MAHLSLFIYLFFLTISWFTMRLHSFDIRFNCSTRMVGGERFGEFVCVCVCSPLELFLLRLISNRLGIIETTEPSGDWNKNIYDFFSFGVFVEISVDFSKILFGRLECIAQMMLFNQFLTSVFSLSLAVGSLQRRYTLNGHICRHIEHTDDILLVNSVILSRCISIFFGFLNERNEWKRSTEKNVAFHAAESEWQHESVRTRAFILTAPQRIGATIDLYVNQKGW